MLSEIITTDRNLLHSPGQPLGLTTGQPKWAICAVVKLDGINGGPGSPNMTGDDHFATHGRINHGT